MKVKSEWVKKKWKHPVYSEILLKINTRTLTVTQLAPEFKKTRNALIEQMHVLEEEGYLLRTKKPEGERNVVYFKVNWKKIVDGFHTYLKELRSDIKIKKEFAKDKDVQYCFQEIFKGYHNEKFYVPLEGIFRNIVLSTLESEIIYYRKNKVFEEWVLLLSDFRMSDDLFLYVFDNFIKKLNKRLSKD